MFELDKNEISPISGGGCNCWCQEGNKHKPEFMGITNDIEECLQVCLSMVNRMLLH